VSGGASGIVETAFKFYVIERDGAVVTVIRSHHQRLAGRDQLVVEKLQSDAAEVAMPSYIPEAEAWREVGEEPQQWAAWMDAAEKREIKRQADAAARELAQRFGVPAALDRSERTTVIVRATPKFFVSLGGAQYRRDTGHIVGGGRWDASLSKSALAELRELAGERAKVDFVRERAAAAGVKVPR
jgi:hypothetical protein